MKGTRFWAPYLAIVALMLSGVYLATANFDGHTLLLSPAEMQQLKGGTVESNSGCEWITLCGQTCDVNIPPFITVTGYQVLRCFSDPEIIESCEDDAGPQNVVSCFTEWKDTQCKKVLSASYTWTYQCQDGIPP